MARAIVMRAPGGPEVLKTESRPVPQPGPGQVLIKVAYAGINRHDCSQRKRGYGPKGAPIFPAWKSPARSSRSART